MTAWMAKVGSVEGYVDREGNYFRLEGPKGNMYALKAGYIYCIEATGSPLVKIGRTQNPDQRLSDIHKASPLPCRISVVVGNLGMPGALKMERALHEMFEDRRSHAEWFNLAIDEAIEAIIGLTTHMRDVGPFYPATPTIFSMT